MRITIPLTIALALGAPLLLAACPKKAKSVEEAFSDPDYPDERDSGSLPGGPVPGPGGPDDPRRPAGVIAP